MATWFFEPGHTAALFRARHMMVTYVRGHFKNVVSTDMTLVSVGTMSSTRAGSSSALRSTHHPGRRGDIGRPGRRCALVRRMSSTGFMVDTQTLLARAYAAFNHRDIEGALALMSENVSWPKASEGGRVVGKEEIRSYWTRQWKEFDPHVEPLEMIDREGGITEVRVHQIVKSLGADVLSESEVWHVYTVANGLIERMDVKEGETNLDSTPSAAFSRQ